MSSINTCFFPPTLSSFRNPCFCCQNQQKLKTKKKKEESVENRQGRLDEGKSGGILHKQKGKKKNTVKFRLHTRTRP